jgi:hypothetical protein
MKGRNLFKRKTKKREENIKLKKGRNLSILKSRVNIISRAQKIFGGKRYKQKFLNILSFSALLAE